MRWCSYSVAAAPGRSVRAQSGSELGCAGVTEVVEHLQCLPPVVACGVRTPSGVVGIADVSKDVGFVESMALATDSPQKRMSRSGAESVTSPGGLQRMAG